MAEKFKVTGYESFVQFMKELKSEGKIVNVLFTGAKNENVSKLSETACLVRFNNLLLKGVSWCPDCVEAEPFIAEGLEKYGDNTMFVTVDVGDRSV